MPELELASTEELIQELMKRTTFAGMVLYSPEEHRKQDQMHSEFRLLTAASAEDTMDLLARAMESVRDVIN